MLQDPSQQATVQTPAIPPVPPAPIFPQTRIDVQQEGVVITIAIAPTTQFVQFIPDDMMDQINKKRLELKKQQRSALATLNDIKRSNTPH